MVAIPNLLLRSLLPASIASALDDRLASLQSANMTGCALASTNMTGTMHLATVHGSLVPPTNATPVYVGIGFGVQNYTCTPANNFTYVSRLVLVLYYRPHAHAGLRNIGAVAQLLDASCLVPTPLFVALPAALHAFWTALPPAAPTIQSLLALLHSTPSPLAPSLVLAQHYFVTNPLTGAGVSPKWDFSSSGNPALAGDADAVVVARPKGSAPAPNAAADVNWLDVVNVGGPAGGRIADEVFRTDTIGGQPPSSCVFGQTQDVSVKYVATYWFFRNNSNSTSAPDGQTQNSTVASASAP
ncbi:hypothetical protein EIP86_005922 [Pleurotus ostreatoroseus]|nr:hypothetical protein EIP86_005922 [Pleurotus ostreatoroseus]